MRLYLPQLNWGPKPNKGIRVNISDFITSGCVLPWTESKYTVECMCVLLLTLEAEKQDEGGERVEGGEGNAEDVIQYRQIKPQHVRDSVSPMEKTKLREGRRPAQSHTAMPSVSRVEAFPPIAVSELASDPGGSHHCHGEQGV